MALLVLAGTTISSDYLSSWDRATGTFADLSDRNVDALQTDISTLSATVLPDRDIVEVALKNNGQTAVANFDQWDIIVQYYDDEGTYYVNWLPYVDGTPGNNQWTVKGIYISAETETSELLEPGILNPGEEIIVQVKLRPEVGTNTTNLVAINTPGGITASIHFQP